MFEIAFIAGIYSYLVFFLGIFNILHKNFVVIVTLLYFGLVLFYFLRTKKIPTLFKKIRLDKVSIVLTLLIIIQALVNLIGVFGPEISFDALWYHLTIPKLFLINHSVFNIPGGLLYYSDMPKLVEMLYVGALSFGSEIFAKLIHFFFGILILISIYKISRKFISEKYSLIAAMIFYSSLVVGWESIAAYVDLSRTFFEIMAFWGFLNWFENKKNLKWLIISGIMLGFAITAKLIAFESLIIFLGLFIYEAICRKTKIITFFKDCFVFVLSSLIIPLPWFIFSYVNTGNPFYPYFSKIAVDSGQTFSFPNLTIILKDFYNLFLNLSDPISPLYLILLPLIFISLKKSELKIKLLALYMFLSILIWYLTLEARGGRFVLPYLPVFSIIASYSIYKLRSRGLRFFLIIVVVLIFLSSISYRYLANSKFIPVILGQETKSKFLIKNLNFSFGDFYDTDGYLRKKIKPSDNVLLFGFHNLYYIDFPFVDSSFVKKGDVFDYIAVQNSIPPARFSYWKLIYSNNLTKVKLYSKGGKTWVY